MAQQNYMQTTQKNQVQIAQSFIGSMEAQWKKVLPKHCTPERFARVALSCVNGNRTLGEMINTPSGQVSLAAAFMKCAEVGLEPNGRDAHLIPFNTKNGPQIQFIIDYKGIVQLVRRSGEVANIIPGIVKDNDDFSFENGVINHRIDFKKPRGNSYAYYVRVIFKDGSEQCEVMSREDVEEIRKRSRSANNGPWVTDFDAMSLKTVFKRLSKWLPLSSEVNRAIQLDNEDEREREQFRNITPVREQKRSRFAGKPLDEAFAEEMNEYEEPSQNTQKEASEMSEEEYTAMINDNLAKNNVPCDCEDIKKFCTAKNYKYDLKEIWNNLTSYADSAVAFRDNEMQ